MRAFASQFVANHVKWVLASHQRPAVVTTVTDTVMKVQNTYANRSARWTVATARASRPEYVSATRALFMTIRRIQFASRTARYLVNRMKDVHRPIYALAPRGIA